MSQIGVSNIELRVGTSDSFDITSFVDRLVWTESMLAGGFSWSIQFKAEQWQEWDTLILGREQPKLWLRLRSVEGGIDTSTEWRRAITDRSRVAFSQNKTMPGLVVGADRRLNLAQVTRTRGWPNTTVANVVNAIAAEHGFDVDVQSTSAVDMERIQVRTTDWAFMRSAARGATADGGRGDIYLWMDENTIRLRVPAVADLSDRRYDLSVVENRIERYVVQYNGRQVDREGGGTLRAVGFDFTNKAGILFNADEIAASAQPSLAARVPRDPNDALVVVAVAEDNAERVEEEARSMWGKKAPRYFSVRVETKPDLALGVNSMVEINGNIDAEQETPFAGRYAALELQHIYENGSLRTMISCFRREAQGGEALPTGSSANNIGTRDRDQFGQTQKPKTIKTAQAI